MLLVRCPVVRRCIQNVSVIMTSIRLPWILLRWVIVLWLLSAPRLMSVGLWLVGISCGKSGLLLRYSTARIVVRLPFRL